MADPSAAMDGVEYKTVVVVFGERRRPVQFKSCDTPKEEADNLFEAVADCFKDITDIEPKKVPVRVLNIIYSKKAVNGV